MPICSGHRSPSHSAFGASGSESLALRLESDAYSCRDTYCRLLNSSPYPVPFQSGDPANHPFPADHTHRRVTFLVPFLCLVHGRLPGVDAGVNHGGSGEEGFVFLSCDHRGTDEVGREIDEVERETDEVRETDEGKKAGSASLRGTCLARSCDHVPECIPRRVYVACSRASRLGSEPGPDCDLCCSLFVG